MVWCVLEGPMYLGIDPPLTYLAVQPIAQWVELLVFNHPLNFFCTVWFTLSTPPFDSECLGKPLTIWHPGNRFFSSLMTRSMNPSSNTILRPTWFCLCPENSPPLSVWRILGGPCSVKIVNSAKATVVALFATMGMETSWFHDQCYSKETKMLHWAYFENQWGWPVLELQIQRW